MRVSKPMLEIACNRLNCLLKKIRIRPAYRYNYTALDIYKPDGICIGTLETGLTKKEAFQIVQAIYQVLIREQVD